MKYLLDTSVVSELVKPKPEEGVIRWLRERDDALLFLSVLTLGELHMGVARLPAGGRKQRLVNWLDEELARRFEGRLLAVDAETAVEWGRLRAAASARGESLPVVDSLIAATAIVHHLTVATRNVKDLVRCGAPIFDPWTA